MTAVCSIPSQSAADRANSERFQINFYRQPSQISSFQDDDVKDDVAGEPYKGQNLKVNENLVYSPCQKWEEMTKMRRRRNQQRAKLRRRPLWVE